MTTTLTMEKTQTISSNSEILHEIGEHFAAGYFEYPDDRPAPRAARGVRSYLSHFDLPEWTDATLYPTADSVWVSNAAVQYHYSASMTYSRDLLLAKLESATTEQRDAIEAVDEALRDYPMVRGYTHSIPNYGRILREGLDSYRERIEAGSQRADETGQTEKAGFYHAMSIVLDGVRTFHRRVLDLLKSSHSDGSKKAEANRAALIKALERVPFQPARTFYEAIVATNFIFYLDGSDNLGRFDQDLWPYYERDIRNGFLRREDALEWVKQMWTNVDTCTGWNIAIGGTKPNGESAINDLTLLCIEAAKSRRRPNLALRLREDASDAVWNAAFDCIATGCGLPALYNEEAYLDAIRGVHLNVPESEITHFAFGGCTELMIHGRSNVGSLDGDINLPQILVSTLHNSLSLCESFDDFLERYKHDLREAIAQITDSISDAQATKAQYQPQVIRSLLIDDCIENGREYNAGGARYNWSVINVMGLANVIDSLSAVREVVYQRQEISTEGLLAALRSDFADHETLGKRLETCPRFGNDDENADDIAEEISELVFQDFLKRAPWRGGKFVPGCLMFVTYADFGKPVGATPDGRHAGQPIADSAGAVQGRDKKGPTALIRSVTRLKHHLAPGTLVVNIRLSKSFFRNSESRAKLKDLITSYFRMGGMQIQINVVDQKVLRDAIEHPERHNDLIIRVGGYSEYFNRLSDALKSSVLERTEHE